jgi:hypothetical protein
MRSGRSRMSTRPSTSTCSLLLGTWSSTRC